MKINNLPLLKFYVKLSMSTMTTTLKEIYIYLMHHSKIGLQENHIQSFQATFIKTHSIQVISPTTIGTQ